MIFGRSRWHSLYRLGEALTRVAERAEVRRLAQEDADRLLRLGDLEGQTSRANALSERLESSVLVAVTDSVTVKPKQWPLK